MSGLLGKKIGMTSIYDEAGKMVPVLGLLCFPDYILKRVALGQFGMSL